MKFKHNLNFFNNTFYREQSIILTVILELWLFFNLWVHSSKFSLSFRWTHNFFFHLKSNLSNIIIIICLTFWTLKSATFGVWIYFEPQWSKYRWSAKWRFVSNSKKPLCRYDNNLIDLFWHASLPQNTTHFILVPAFNTNTDYIFKRPYELKCNQIMS